MSWFVLYYFMLCSGLLENHSFQKWILFSNLINHMWVYQPGLLSNNKTKSQRYAFDQQWHRLSLSQPVSISKHTPQFTGICRQPAGLFLQQPLPLKLARLFHSLFSSSSWLFSVESWILQRLKSHKCILTSVVNEWLPSSSHKYMSILLWLTQ